MTAWRTAPLPDDWYTRIRPAILTRDDRTCQSCGEAGNEVDHIVPAAFGGGDEEANLQVLCTQCHRAKSARERTALRRQRAAARWRTPEAHPTA